MIGMFTWAGFYRRRHRGHETLYTNGMGRRFRCYQNHAPRRRRWGIGARLFPEVEA